MAKKGDAFVLESEVLNQARTILESGNRDGNALYEAYSNLVEEYNKLLDEARFITKVSDKLEAKLNTANEKLRSYNETLATEADQAKTDREKAISKSRQLLQEKKEVDSRSTKQQVTLVIFVAIYLVTATLLVWLGWFNPKTACWNCGENDSRPATALPGNLGGTPAPEGGGAAQQPTPGGAAEPAQK